MTIAITYTCTACDAETELTVEPGSPGRLCGPPERCYPPDPMFFEPDTCECGAVIDSERVSDLLEGAEQDAKDREADYYETRWEDK